MNNRKHNFTDDRKNGFGGTAVNKNQEVVCVVRKAAESEEAENINTVGIADIFFRIIDNIKFIIVSALLCALLGAAYALFFITPKYEATAKLYVSGGSKSGMSYALIQASTALAVDYMEAFDTREVRELVLEELNLDYSHAELRDMVKINVPGGTRVMYITVSHADAKLAADIANAYAGAGIAFIGDTMNMAAPDLISAAVAPARPITHGVVFYTVMGFAAGLVLIVCIIAVIAILEDKPRNPDEIFRMTGIPVIAVIPMQKKQIVASNKGLQRK